MTGTANRGYHHVNDKRERERQSEAGVRKVNVSITCNDIVMPSDNHVSLQVSKLSSPNGVWFVVEDLVMMM